MSDCIVRPAKVEDCQQIVDLIKELAVFEKSEDQVKITADVLRRDGFGDDKFYHCMVAETIGDSPVLIGYALYYFIYSTWVGRALFLEDLYVKPEFRGNGIGTQLWKSVTKVGVEKKCRRMQWCVLNWNSPSIEYYKRRGGIDLTETEKWHVFRMNENDMRQFMEC